MSGPYKGSCMCGHIRWRASSTPVSRTGCCCRDSARATGSAYTVWLGFHAETLTFDGEVREFASSSDVMRGHCARCGTTLTYRRIGDAQAGDPLIHVTASSLDQPERGAPSETVYYDQRPAWFALSIEGDLHPGESPGYSGRAAPIDKAES